MWRFDNIGEADFFGVKILNFGIGGASRTYLVFQGRPRSKQSIFTNAQVNLRRLSDNIRYWPAIFDYHPANLSR